MKSLRWILAIGAAMFLVQPATASDFDPGATGKRPITVGAGILWRDKIYDDYEDSDKMQPFPLILYEGDRFFFRASNFGWKFVRGGEWEVSVLGEFQGDGYDESSSDTLDGMDDRDPYFGAGGQVTWQPSKWGFTLRATTDIASESDGSQVGGHVHYTHKEGSLLWRFAGGGKWLSEDYVDYYFGVKGSEAIPGVRPRYSPDEEMTYDLSGLLIYQQQTSPWMIATGAKYTFYGDEVDDSPITSDDRELALFFGIGYTFRK